MDNSEDSSVRTEVKEISDAEFPPDQCPHCESDNFTRASYYIRIVQDLGQPGIKREIRYESVVWKCNKCKTHFTIHNREVTKGKTYSPGVIQYVIHRVLNKGDSNRRVLEDLKELHNVDISIGTINAWVNEAAKTNELPTDFTSYEPPDDYSGAMSVDGTFRVVKPKKNKMQEEGNEPLWLRLTHLPDGRLVAYWRPVKTKKK
ncbi:MAG: hypothetical protein ACTSVZ_04905 [Promethearchaeota archaeon]